MGELERMSTNNIWIWVILAFLLLSGSNCGITGIFDQFKCSFGNLFCGNNWIWIAILAFLFFNNGMGMC
ncbi:MAG: hypothetical protein AB9856_09000 [Cellulosilyticaceae bacterium]